MKVFVNTKEIEVLETATLPDALEKFCAIPPFAVMVNEEFVAKSQQENFVLSEHDKIEVLSAIQGG